MNNFALERIDIFFLNTVKIKLERCCNLGNEGKNEIRIKRSCRKLVGLICATACYERRQSCGLLRDFKIQRSISTNIRVLQVLVRRRQSEDAQRKHGR